MDLPPSGKARFTSIKKRLLSAKAIVFSKPESFAFRCSCALAVNIKLARHRKRRKMFFIGNKCSFVNYRDVFLP